jgi:CheY-like chemotaxis protein
MSISNLFPQAEILRDMQILVVDNDQDTRDLYAYLLESYGAKVTTLGSVKAAWDFLDWCIPALLICEMRFLGESVYPLVQHVRELALSRGKRIPILATSTYSLANLTQEFQVTVEAYFLKPVDMDDLVDQAWRLTLQSSSIYLPTLQDWGMNRQNGRAETVQCGAGLS